MDNFVSRVNNLQWPKHSINHRKNRYVSLYQYVSACISILGNVRRIPRAASGRSPKALANLA